MGCCPTWPAAPATPSPEPSLPMGTGWEAPVLLLSLPGQDSERCWPSNAPFSASKWGMGIVTVERPGVESSVEAAATQGTEDVEITSCCQFQKTGKKKKQPDALFCPFLWLRIICMVGLHTPVPLCSSTQGRFSKRKKYKMPSAKKKGCL